MARLGLAGQGADRKPEQCSKRSTRSSSRRSTLKKKTRKVTSAARDQGREAAQKRVELILELYKIAPDHKRIPALDGERWKLIGTPEKTRYAELVAELDKVITQHQRQTLEDRGGLLEGDAQAQPRELEEEPDPSGVEDFLKLAPKDPRAETLLGTATSVIKDEKKKAALLERLNKEYPGSDCRRNVRPAQPERRDRQAVPPASSPTRSTASRSR